ncbi:MAG: hypothetical protein M1840_004109 [Geoglossum simile]|nr:MAG: hypothetical protein M1840_004109 [Geoglossum simile]
MAPYRPNGQSRRSGARGYVDHDFYEGLPVRHWRRTAVQVGVPPKPENPSRLLQPELPLPKEANLLTPMSRALLQAARAGTINKAPPAEEETVVKEGEDDEDDEERGFVSSRWSVVPRHLEGPEPEYLAKKRKGLESKASAGGIGAGAGGGVAKKAKVRRTDTEGNAYVEEIVISDGQRIEGGVVAEATMADAGVPGVVGGSAGVVSLEGVVVATETVQPTPPRRRPPPPRRKPRGPGRGRKKKVQFVPGAEGTEGAGARGIAPVTINSLTENGQPSGKGVLPGTRPEGTYGHDDGDTEMMDDPGLRDGDEEDDDNEEGEEGDEVDDDDREEGELTPSPTPDGATSSATPNPPKFNEQSTLVRPAVSTLNHPLPPRPDVQAPTTEPLRGNASNSPDLPLADGQGTDLVVKNGGEVIVSVPMGEDIITSIKAPTPAQADRLRDPIQGEEDPVQGLVQTSQLRGFSVEEDPAKEDPDPFHGSTQEKRAHEDLMLEDLIQDDLVQQDPTRRDLAQEGLINLEHEDLIQEDLKHEDLTLEDLIQEMPVRECLEREGSGQGDPIQEFTMRGEPGPEDLFRESLVRDDLAHMNDPVQEDPLQEDPVLGDLVQGDPVQEDLVQGDPVEEDPLQTSLAQEGDPASPPQFKLTNDAVPSDAATHDIEIVEEVHFLDGDIDLFGSLEKHLAEHSSVPLAAAETSPAVENPNDSGK